MCVCLCAYVFVCVCALVYVRLYVRIYVNASNHNMHVCRWVVGSIVVYEDDDDDAKYHSIMLTRRSDEMHGSQRVIQPMARKNRPGLIDTWYIRDFFAYTISTV